VCSKSVLLSNQPLLLLFASSVRPHREFVLIANKGKSESMLIWRFDHTIGDGLSIGKMGSGIITHADGTPLDDLIPPSMRSTKVSPRQSKVMMILKAIPAAIKVAILPISRFDHGIMFAKNVVGKNAKDSHQRKTIIFDAIPLDFVKAIKNKANVSLNDVLLTALSQSIHDFCHHHDCPVIKILGDNARCRAAMTYGFPSEHDDVDKAVHNGWCVP